MLRRLLLVVLPIVASHVGCGLIHGTTRPAAYATELAACEHESRSWGEYTQCCVDVARRYARDPSFCLPDDGNAP